MINEQSPQPVVQESVPTSAPAPFIIRPQLDGDIAAIVAILASGLAAGLRVMARVHGPRLN